MPTPTPMPLSRRAHVRGTMYELPANETVAELIGSPVYEDAFMRRQREIEESRRRIREGQRWRSERLARNGG